MLDSTLLESAAVEEHIESLLTLAENYRSAFDALPPDCEVDIWCTVSSDEEFLGLSLDQNLIGRLASLRMGLVFGGYVDSKVRSLGETRHDPGGV